LWGGGELAMRGWRKYLFLKSKAINIFKGTFIDVG
jgi:hypothetical protein